METKNDNKNDIRYPFTYWVLLAGFGTMFMITSIRQLTSLASFSHELGLDPGLQTLAPVLSWLIPIAQLLIIAAYFSDTYRQTSWWATIGLLCTYTLYIGLMLAFFESSLTAYCQGFQWFTWTGQLYTNLVLLFLSLAACYLGRKAQGKRDAKASPKHVTLATN